MLPLRKSNKQPTALEALQLYESDSEEETPPVLSSNKSSKQNSIKWLGFVSTFVFLLACADTKYALSNTAYKIGEKGFPTFNKALTTDQCLNIVKTFASELKKYNPNESPNGVQPVSGLSAVPSGEIVFGLPGNDASTVSLQKGKFKELLNKPEIDIALLLMMELHDACKNPIYIEWGGHILTFEQMVIFVSEEKSLRQEFVRDVLNVWKKFIDIKTHLVNLIHDVTFLPEKVLEVFTKLPGEINDTCHILFTEIHNGYHKNFSIFLHKLLAFIFMTDIYHSIGAYVFLFLILPSLGKYFINYIIKCIVLIMKRKKKDVTNEELLQIGKAASAMFLENVKTGGGEYIFNDEIVNKIIQKMKKNPECLDDVVDFLKSLPSSVITNTPIISDSTIIAKFLKSLPSNVISHPSNVISYKHKGGSKKTIRRRMRKNNKSRKNRK